MWLLDLKIGSPDGIRPVLPYEAIGPNNIIAVCVVGCEHDIGKVILLIFDQPQIFLIQPKPTNKPNLLHPICIHISISTQIYTTIFCAIQALENILGDPPALPLRSFG